MKTPEDVAAIFEDTYSGLGWTAHDSDALVAAIRELLTAERKRLSKHILQVHLDLGCTAYEATGIVRRTREALAREVLKS